MVFVSSVPTPHGNLPHQWAREQFQAGHALEEMTVPRDGQAYVFGQGQKLVSIESEVGNVIVVDPFQAMCTADVCFTVKENKGLFSDTDHLSEAGVQYIVPSLADAIKRAQDGILANERNAALRGMPVGTRTN